MPRNNSKSSIRVVAFSLMSGNWQKIAALYWIRDISHSLGTGGEGNKTASNGGDRGSTQPVTKSIPARETNILSDAKESEEEKVRLFFFSPPLATRPVTRFLLLFQVFLTNFGFLRSQEFFFHPLLRQCSRKKGCDNSSFMTNCAGMTFAKMRAERSRDSFWQIMQAEDSAAKW